MASPSKKHFLIRISPELYESLDRWAADDLRSVNAQIEWILNDAVRRAGRQTRPKQKGLRRKD